MFVYGTGDGCAAPTAAAAVAAEFSGDVYVGACGLMRSTSRTKRRCLENFTVFLSRADESPTTERLLSTLCGVRRGGSALGED